MRCADALLIHLQGSDAPADEQRAARSHLARCPSCAGTVDDLDHHGTSAAAVLRSLAVHQANPRRGLRRILAALSAIQVLLALPWLVGINPFAVIDDSVEAAHLSRDGAIGLFVGAAGLLAALRPRYAVPAVTVVGLGAITQVVLGAVDEHHAHVDAWFELLHLLTLAILSCTALLAGSRPGGPGHPTRGTGPGLRAVPTDGPDLPHPDLSARAVQRTAAHVSRRRRAGSGHHGDDRPAPLVNQAWSLSWAHRRRRPPPAAWPPWHAPAWC